MAGILLARSVGSTKTGVYSSPKGRSVKILIVDDDDDLVAFLAKELEARGCEILQTHFGDGGLKLYNRYGPWAFVLSDYRFIPGTQIKDGVELVTAIHGINPFQQMAIMTADPKETRDKPPEALRHLPVLRKHFRLEQLLRLLRQPVLPF
jgi:DNA-binding NtrC family response regulator